MRVLRWNQLRDRVPAGRTTVWRWERDGKFPKRFKIGPNSVGWMESEVNDWLKSARDAGSTGGRDASASAQDFYR